MKTVSISGSVRANVGKKDAKALRSAKLVPCVLYGGKEQIHFSVLESEFKKLIYTPEASVVDLSVGDKKYTSVLQDSQFHKISDRLIHADFLEVIQGKPVSVDIPVKTSGASPGVKNGGRLVIKLKYIKVKGLIDRIPEHIVVNIDALQIGDSVRIEDIKIEGLTLLSAPNNTVVSVVTTRVASTAEAAAPAAAKAAAPAAAKAAAPAKDKK